VPRSIIRQERCGGSVEAMESECIIVSEHCPLDQSLDNTLPCHCTQNCTTADTCNRTHHPLFVGTVKDLVFGICAPAVLQPFLKQALANITLIVNSTLHAEDMRGEIESMKAVDAAGPEGIFTSKLTYQQIVRACSMEGGACPHVGVRRILKKLADEDDTMIPDMAQKCICVNGKRDVTCPRCKYLALRKMMESRQKQAIDLHYVYMEYVKSHISSSSSSSTTASIVLPTNTRVLGCESSVVVVSDNKCVTSDLVSTGCTSSSSISSCEARTPTSYAQQRSLLSVSSSVSTCEV